jgi:hypothetical protein
MINEVIKTLGSTQNFHKIIELSKRFKEIDLTHFLQYCPDININFEYSDRIYSNYYNRNISSLKSFRLNDEILQTDISIFFNNIEDVVEMTFDFAVFRVNSGKYYIGDDGFRSIEYDLHDIKKEALNSIFSLYGIIIDEKEHKKLIRQIKYNKLNGGTKSLKKLVEKLKEDKHNNIKEDTKKKQQEKLKDIEKNYNYSNNIITAC